MFLKLYTDNRPKVCCIWSLGKPRAKVPPLEYLYISLTIKRWPCLCKENRKNTYLGDCHRNPQALQIDTFQNTLKVITGTNEVYSFPLEIMFKVTSALLQQGYCILCVTGVLWNTMAQCNELLHWIFTLNIPWWRVRKIRYPHYKAECKKQWNGRQKLIPLRGRGWFEPTSVHKCWFTEKGHQNYLSH